MFYRTLVFAGLCAFSFLVGRSQELSLDWYRQILGNNNQGSSVASLGVFPNGDVLVAATWGGTSDAGLSVSFGGDDVVDLNGKAVLGAPYLSAWGASYSRNCLLTRVSQDGKALWNVYSCKGYCDKLKAVVAPDGGVVACLSTTQVAAVEGPIGDQITIVGADADSLAVANPFADVQISSGNPHKTNLSVLLALDPNGKIKWTRLLSAVDGLSTSPYTVSDLTVGNDGSIFVAGSVSASIVFPSVNGGMSSIVNEADDVDAFIARLNPDGLLVDFDVVRSSGSQKFSTALVCADGSNLYSLETNVSGDNKTFSLYKYDFSKSLGQKTLLKSLESVKNADGKDGYNLYQLKKIGANIYLSMALTGSLTSDGQEVFSTSLGGSQRDGVLLKYDEASEVVSSMSFGCLNSNVWGVTSCADYVWVACSRLANGDGGLSQNAGAHLVALDNDMNVCKVFEVVKGTSISDVCSPVAADGAIFFASRRSKSVSLIEAGDLNPTTYNFNSLVARLVLPGETPSAVMSVAPVRANSRAYNLAGRLVGAGHRGLVVSRGKLIIVR